jgi:hypothetical protein
MIQLYIYIKENIYFSLFNYLLICFYFLVLFNKSIQQIVDSSVHVFCGEEVQDRGLNPEWEKSLRRKRLKLHILLIL